MATEKQIAANRKNSERSTGPKSDEGKAQSRLNATKHGLASDRVEIEATRSPAFLDRRARWGAEQKPEGEAAGWALDRAVAASFRIERCEHAIEAHIQTVQNRAEKTWSEDRALEAATLFKRLDREPILIARQMQTSLAGVILLIEAWLLLLGALEADQDWSDLERSRALDLFGIAPNLRNGLMIVDAAEGVNPIEFRKALVLDEIKRLETLRDESLDPLDDMEQDHAMQGDVALLSKEARLLLRYEREAWKHYHQAMKEIKNPSPVVAPIPSPAPIIPAPPKPRDLPKAPAPPSFEEQRRALLAEAAPYRNEAINRLNAIGIVDEDAMLDELERRLGLLDSSGFPVPDRSQFASFAVGRA